MAASKKSPDKPNRRKKHPPASPATVPFRRCANEAQYRELRKTLQTLKDSRARNPNANGNNPANNNSNNNLPFFLVPHFAPDQISLLAVTLLVNDHCHVLDLLTLPPRFLADLFTLLSASPCFSLVVQSGGTLAAVNSHLHKNGLPALEALPHLYDLSLAHEMLTDLLPPTFSAVTTALAVPTQPDPPPTHSPDLRHLALLAARAHELRAAHAALRARLPRAQRPAWLLKSTSVADVLAVAAANLPPCTPSSPLVAQHVLSFHKRSHAARTLHLLRDALATADVSVSPRSAAEDMRQLLQLLPHHWTSGLEDDLLADLIDIQLDVGRPPFAYFRTRPKLILSGSRAIVVSEENLAVVKQALDELDSDRRTGIPGTLHRVSVMMARNEDVIGVTMRVGRHLFGVASILHDVLLAPGHAHHSVLLLGAPGSGKTTMGRDAARILAEERRVIIVDSSDEMGGCGRIPHSSIGDARRMSVRNGKRGMAAALLEAVQNHTPDVVVVDELAGREEVAGAATARHRGVRMIASAHGDLRSLLKNATLRPLVGGVERVVVGDHACGPGLSGKVRSMRAGEVVFDVIVEMGVVPGNASACRIVHDVQKAVDEIVSGKTYPCELRWRGDADMIFSRPWMA